MPTSAPNTSVLPRADVGIGPYETALNNNLSRYLLPFVTLWHIIKQKSKEDILCPSNPFSW